VQPMMFALDLAFAHGGEDHGAPAAAPAAAADVPSVAASGSVFETVLRAPEGLSGNATLLVADWATSAPIAEGTATLSLTGPGPAQAEFVPTRQAGTWTAPLAFPSPGAYAGALVVTSGERSDLLAVPEIAVGAPHEHADDGPASWSVPVVVSGIGLALLVGLAAGWFAGRRGRGARRLASAAALVAVAVAAERVNAHGGEDHGAPAAAAPAQGGALALRMESQFLLEVRTQPVVRDVFVEQVEALGRFLARPGATATLRAPVAGLLRAPDGGFPTPGQEVRAGDVLALIAETAPAGERAALAQGEAEVHTALAEARARLALAERDAARAAELGDAISPRERLQREQAVASAREALLHAERAAASFGSRTQVRAPLPGRLAHSEARPGDHVEPGDALFRIVGGDALWVEVEVPEAQAARISGGAAATVATPAGALLDAVVLDAGQEVDPATGHVTITMAVQGEDPSLRPGMSATAWIDAGPRRDALVVPDASVVESGGEALVFVKTGPESFAARPVRLRGRAGDVWEVSQGLSAGERAVVQGTYALRSLAGR
ncbi:MAG: efflux RND transporter periplasmic adaptor subunit, partial [Myxococcota bacterium]